MLKRAFDLLFSFIALVILFPFLLIISVIIMIDSKGWAFFLQKRVGKNNKDFYLFKFRTMHKHADKKGLLTVGEKDSRITRFGYKLRKYKLDELPQLLNVFIGNMSFVGPRPEVRKYVEMYNDEQKKVLTVKPGITDVASIAYSNENAILSKYENPEEGYICEIMPAKIKLNLQYISNRSFAKDIGVIAETIRKIFIVF
jgi:lipopolysaccharide/colanic/teichoic acid biosynthesis glycosyltransferase